jgi:hypothetical protein
VSSVTDDEWDGVCLLIENAWKGEFDDVKAAAYRFFLGDLAEGAVMAALKRLVRNGTPFLPAAAEIVKAADDMALAPAPSWTEAWLWIGKALRRGGRVGGARWDMKAKAAYELLEAHDMAIVARFIEAEGYQRLAMTEFFDPDYGPLRVRELEQRWNAFVGVAQERLERGLALNAVNRRQAGPTRLSEAALAQVVGRRELESGDSVD